MFEPKLQLTLAIDLRFILKAQLEQQRRWFSERMVAKPYLA